MLPPEPDLGPPLAQLGPSQKAVKVWMGFLIVGTVGSVLALLSDVPVLLAFTLMMALVGLYQVAGARRAFIAVGAGWIFFRTEPWGGGWIRTANLTSAALSKPRQGSVPFLRLTGPSFVARLSLVTQPLGGLSDLQREIGRELLRNPFPMEQDARDVLETWADKATH
jgi:hypothetical protein